LITVQSKLTGQEHDFHMLKSQLEPYGFALGGNWEYTGGSLDCCLDGEKQTVWLRIPFHVVVGQLDPDARPEGALVKIGEPYVLRHLYREGDDPTADMNVVSGLVNQFQLPKNPDAEVKDHYVREAEALLRKIEAKL